MRGDPRRISSSVATTIKPGAFDCQGVYANSSDMVVRLIGAYVAPSNAAPAHSPTLPIGCS